MKRLPNLGRFLSLSASKHRRQDSFLLAWQEMAISPFHFFREMTNPFIDETLIHAAAGEIGNERVPKAMPPLDNAPFGAR